MIEVAIFTVIGIIGLFKPEVFISIIFKNKKKNTAEIVRVLGVIAIINAVMNFVKLKQ